MKKLINIKDLREPIYNWYKKYYGEGKMFLCGSAAFAAFKHPEILENDAVSNMYSDVDFFTTSTEAVVELAEIIRQYSTANSKKLPLNARAHFNASVYCAGANTNVANLVETDFNLPHYFDNVFSHFRQRAVNNANERFSSDIHDTSYLSGIKSLTLANLYDPLTNRFYKIQSIKFYISCIKKREVFEDGYESSTAARTSSNPRCNTINIILLHDITEHIDIDHFNSNFNEFLTRTAADLKHIIQNERQRLANDTLPSREILLRYLSQFDFINSQLILTPDGQIDFSAVDLAQINTKIIMQSHLAKFPKADREIVEICEKININPISTIVHARFILELSQKFAQYIQVKVEDKFYHLSHSSSFDMEINKILARTRQNGMFLEHKKNIHIIANTSLYYERMYCDLFPINFISDQIRISEETLMNDLVPNIAAIPHNYTMFAMNFFIDSRISIDHMTYEDTIKEDENFFHTYGSLAETILHNSTASHTITYFRAVRVRPARVFALVNYLDVIFDKIANVSPCRVFDTISTSLQSLMTLSIFTVFNLGRAAKYIKKFGLTEQRFVDDYTNVIFSHFIKAFTSTLVSTSRVNDFINPLYYNGEINGCEINALDCNLNIEFVPEAGTPNVRIWPQVVANSIASFIMDLNVYENSTFADVENFQDALVKAREFIDKKVALLERRKNMYKLMHSIAIDDETLEIKEFINNSNWDAYENLSLPLYILKDAEKNKSISVILHKTLDIFIKANYLLTNLAYAPNIMNVFANDYFEMPPKYFIATQEFLNVTEDKIEVVVFSPTFYWLSKFFESNYALEKLKEII